MALSAKRIFMSGGAGFIGSALAERLIDRNHLVVYDTFERNAIRDRPFVLT